MRGKILSIVLFASLAASGLWAQTENDEALESTLQGAARPLRSRRTDISDNIYPKVNAHRYISTDIDNHPSPILNPEILAHRLVTYYIDRYSSPGGITWLNSIIRNGSVYIPFVKEEIAKYELPSELVYLPFIESGYLGTARSKSGATGLWQFMMNSISPYHIKVDDTIDERRDFRKSTDAALRKLAENYRILGDWPLALAAYNAGLGAVSRLVKKVPDGDYWTLCEKGEFKTETVHYVPKFLAVSYILSRPRQFGVDYWPETVEWTTIKPGKHVSLETIVHETGLDRDLLRRLNTELLIGITPEDKNYELKIPPDYVQALTELLDKDIPLLRIYQYKIQYGDTLSALSRHYSVSIDMIEANNPGISKRYLKIGETIAIPALKEVPPYNGGADAKAPNPAGGAFEGIHYISQGDTLWSLAIRYQVDPQTLAAENGMELNQILSIGKALKVPIE